MDRDAALAIVVRHLSGHFEIPPEKITLEAHLFRDLDLDSIDALDMIGLLEAELGVAVNENELKALRTVADVVDYVTRHAPAAPSAP